MKSRLSHDLSPWNISEETTFRSRQYYSESCNKCTPNVVLPKIQKAIIYLPPAKCVQVKLRESKQKIQQQLKINPVQIGLLSHQDQQHTNQLFYSTRKERKLSFNPPMISFYNKKHPKLKKLKQKSTMKVPIVEERKTQESQIVRNQSLSKINLMEGLMHSNQKQKPTHSQSFIKDQDNKDIGLKGSLSQLLFFLRNSERQVDWTQRVSSYLKKEQFNGINRFSHPNHSFQHNTVSLDEQAFQPYREVEKIRYLSKKQPTMAIKKKF